MSVTRIIIQLLLSQPQAAIRQRLLKACMQERGSCVLGSYRFRHGLPSFRRWGSAARARDALFLADVVHCEGAFEHGSRISELVPEAVPVRDENDGRARLCAGVR